MQNYCKTIGAIVAASALVAGTASAEIEYEIHTGYSSLYLFRGTDLGQDLIEAGVDMSTEYMGLGLSAGAWYGSFGNKVAPATGLSVDTDFSELDIYGEVSKDLGYFTAAIGYIAYLNRDAEAAGLLNQNFANDDAQEVYFSVAQTYYGIDFSLTYFWDIEADNNGYTELAMGKGFELSSCLTLNTGVAIAYLWEEGDFAHITAKVALDWAFTETATLSPFVAASFELEDGYNGGGDDELVAGSMLSVSF